MSPQAGTPIASLSFAGARAASLKSFAQDPRNRRNMRETKSSILKALHHPERTDTDRGIRIRDVLRRGAC
jgi:hypothetical protein